MEYKKVYRKSCSDRDLEQVVEEIINNGGTIIDIFEIYFAYDEWIILYYMTVDGLDAE